MGSFDRAETSELVELFLFSQLTHLDVNYGLTPCTKNAPPSRSGQKRSMQDLQS